LAEQESTMAISLRDMAEDDLPLVVEWMARPHVDRWWHEVFDLDAMRAKYLPRLAGVEPTFMLTVLADGVPIGLAQWYRWDDYAEDRDNYRIGVGELGIDYAIGELSACGHGAGTAMVGLLVELLGALDGGAVAVAVTPEAANSASRRILEKNGFALVDVFQTRHLDGRTPEGPTALYRRALGAGTGGSDPRDVQRHDVDQRRAEDHGEREAPEAEFDLIVDAGRLHTREEGDEPGEDRDGDEGERAQPENLRLVGEAGIALGLEADVVHETTTKARGRITQGNSDDRGLPGVAPHDVALS
jgi:RimJ/RimL family protein N-acetyltransferase